MELKLTNSICKLTLVVNRLQNTDYTRKKTQLCQQSSDFFKMHNISGKGGESRGAADAAFYNEQKKLRE